MTTKHGGVGKKLLQGGYSAQIGVHAVRFRLMFVDLSYYYFFPQFYAYYACTYLDEDEEEAG